jgi:hypothetical protein
MMKPRCILHIGMPKTGSSSIQEALSQEHKITGCEYLDIGDAGNHSTIIYSLFSQRPELHHAHVAMQRTKKEVEDFVHYHREQLDSRLSSICSQQYVISGEDILFLKEEELRALKSYLLQFSSEVLVVAYVRPPISFMQSAFQQNIKQGDLRFGIAGYFPRYRERLERFDLVFGRENVSLIKFDPASLLAGDVVVDFCNRIGIEKREQPHKAGNRVNESLSLEAIALLYLSYKFGSNDTYLLSEQKKELVQFLSTFGARKFQYSKRFAAQILAQIADDIRWMETRLGCSLAEVISEHDEGIGSEEDLEEIAFAYREKLFEFISQELWQQMDTLQGMGEVIWRVTRPVRKQNLIPVWNISFSVDMLHNDCLWGWVVDKNNPLNKLSIEIRQAQRVIAQGVANHFRADLADAKIGDGCCAFSIPVDPDWTNDGGKMFLRVVDFNQEFEIDTALIKGMSHERV